ncbi:NAD-dependent epimerase/dehydratase family protein [Nocardia mangyaensis]|uniref:NAD-dependent epimerase/dehydratase family protein n=1 Tax=Nocardia mangyaensis TaxID=2213200 RepID=UPI0026770402|nr:NAD-dependent epimerase/dehydratase family protein [Nocardia mangyaensis]MDO3646223.1 sugar nucleotide-binding protein [Nocardia mangyaensis]
MNVLVLGGYGAVGAHLVQLLRAQGISALAAGRDAARADRAVDATTPDGFAAALSGVTTVVNCAGVEDIRVAEECVRRGIAFVEISATSDYVRALEHVRGPVLLGVGLAPGLTTLLAVDAFASDPGPIDIMIGLGSGEHHGPAATAWTYQLLGQRFPDPDGADIRNFTRPARFTIPEKARYKPFPAVRADFADQHRLTDELAVPIRSYLRLDSRLATAGLAALTWIPALRGVAPRHMPGSDRWVVLARSANNSDRWATGRGQSLATATVAAATVRELARRQITSPTWIHELLDLDTLRNDLSTTGIEFGQSTAVI